jgi:hypothetical protein
MFLLLPGIDASFWTHRYEYYYLSAATPCVSLLTLPHCTFMCDGTAAAIHQFRNCPSRHVAFEQLITSFCWHITFSSFWRYVEFCVGKYLWMHLLWLPRWRWNLRRQTVMMELAQDHVQRTLKFCYNCVSLSLSRSTSSIHVVGYRYHLKIVYPLKY